MDNRENEVVYLHLDDIIPNRFQPRQVFDEKALKELAVSIKEHGVIQPIIVRNIGNKYEIIAGERRYKASALAGLTKIPAIIRNLDDKESSKVALLENLQRKNLNPIEEAKTYQKILELDEMTQEALAKTMGKSQGAVANKIRLLSLTDEVQEALLKEQISERHARTLLNISDPKIQKEMLKEVINNKMTVRELEEKIKKEEKMPNQVPNDIENLLNPSQASPLNYLIPDVPKQENQDFNQNVGIDYSTPPKFIDYETQDNINLESTANKPIDINALKENAKDINQEPPKVDINNFLSVENQADNEPQETNYKFFEPFEDNIDKKEESNAESTKNQFDFATPKEDLFSKVDPFSLNEETKKLEDATSTSMDNLLENVENNTKTELPQIDTFNNPFAKNHIFQDNIEKINKEIQENNKRYSLNESINLIRDVLKKIEVSGQKIDVEEMDFVNNYQIVIKISKENELNEKVD